MKLWVDDLRTAPEGWELARTIKDAIRMLATGLVEEVSLDHDIACFATIRFHDAIVPVEHTSEETFEPVAHYIALMPVKPIVRIHTGNPVGGERMAEILGMEYEYGG